jgi:alpha-galactosidase
MVPAGTLGGTYPVSVTATYTWGAERQPASTLNELNVTVVVPPRDGRTPVSVLVPISASNAVGDVERDMSVGGQTVADGNLITLGGNVYTRGLGTNAPSTLVYYLGGRCSSLTTDVGIDDEVTSGGSATFQIYADDALVTESSSLTAADAAQTLTADLTGATLLRLVTVPGAASDGDHADWAAPQIVCGTSTAPTTTDQTLFSFETDTESWTLSNPAAGGSMALSTAFHTAGSQGLQLTSPGDGNWFGRVLAAPLDLTGKTLLAFDLKTGEIGTSGEFAVQVGAGANPAWCQGGKWTWTNPNSSRTIKTAFSEMTCPAGTTMDVSQIGAVWVFVKGGTFTIDQVRAE